LDDLQRETPSVDGGLAADEVGLGLRRATADLSRMVRGSSEFTDEPPF
jgi:hypothetical protein